MTFESAVHIPDYSINNIDSIKRQYDGHFFDKDALRFFNSRISDRVYPTFGHKGTYFVTSERNDDYGRFYTVRVAYWTENERGFRKLEIETVGEFQQYGNARAAHKSAKILASHSLHPSIIAMREAAKEARENANA